MSTKTGLGEQVSAGGKGQIYNPSAGHVNQVNWASNAGKKKENTIVIKQAPINPSQVLLGDSAKNGADINRRPKAIPVKYAETSFIVTVENGKKNQNSPLSVFKAKNLLWKTTMHTVTIDHMCWLSWKRIIPGRRVSTEVMNVTQYNPYTIVSTCLVIHSR